MKKTPKKIKVAGTVYEKLPEQIKFDGKIYKLAANEEDSLGPMLKTLVDLQKWLRKKGKLELRIAFLKGRWRVTLAGGMPVPSGAIPDKQHVITVSAPVLSGAVTSAMNQWDQATFPKKPGVCVECGRERNPNDSKCKNCGSQEMTSTNS